MDSASKQKVLDWLADSSDEDDDPATPDAAPAAQFSITSPDARRRRPRVGTHRRPLSRPQPSRRRNRRP